MRTNRIAAVGLAALALAGCGRGAADSSSQPPDLVARDFAFKPTELTAKAGEQTTWHLVNDGNTKHNITIEELGVDQDVDVRGMTTFTFTAEPGVYEYVCKFHATQMTGELTAE